MRPPTVFGEQLKQSVLWPFVIVGAGLQIQGLRDIILWYSKLLARGMRRPAITPRQVWSDCLSRIRKLARSLWERACPRTRAKPVPSIAVSSSRVTRSHRDHAVICAMFSGCGKSSRHGVPVLSIALRRTMKILMQATSATLASFPRPRSASYRALSVGLCFTATRHAMYSARLTSNRPPEIKRLPTDFPLS